MKKLLLGSAALTLFAIAITLLQISCQKETQAQTTTFTLSPATTTTLGGVIVGSGLSVTSNGTLSVTSSGTTQQNKILFVKSIVSGTTERSEIWTANYDGTNAQKINIIVPSGMTIDGEIGPAISPDRQTIFFSMSNTTLNINNIYSCKLDGTSLTKVVDGTGTSEVNIGSIY